MTKHHIQSILGINTAFKIHCEAIIINISHFNSLNDTNPLGTARYGRYFASSSASLNSSKSLNKKKYPNDVIAPINKVKKEKLKSPRKNFEYDIAENANVKTINPYENIGNLSL